TPMTPGPMTPRAPGRKTALTRGAVTPPPPLPVSHESHEKSPVEKARKQAAEKGDSNRLAPYVMAVASDLSRELGDGAHEMSNMTQANSLWQESGLTEAAFVALMQEARQRTRRAQGGQGTGLVSNRAAYYFQVLRSLVQTLADDQAGDPD